VTRTRWVRSLAAALAALVALALVACGASTSTTSGGGATAAAGAAGATTAATSAATPDTSGSGGTLRIGMTAGNIPIPNTPPDQGFEGRRFVGNQIYDALFNWDDAQGDTVPTVIPALATSYTMSDDKLTWTFTLRQNVKFHDGTPFNADAVVFEYRRLRDKSFEYYDATTAASNASSFAFIDSIAKVDDYTVAVKTKTVYAFLPYDLVYLYIPSPTAIEKYGNKDYAQHATGTGPFMMTKYVDGQVMELTANPDYWGGKPKLDKVILYPMPEPATRLAALQSGDIDWAELPPPDSVEQLKAQGYQVFLKEYPHTILYVLNLHNGPLQDVRIRQALEYAVDRQGTATLINNVGYPATQYMYKGNPWYDDSWAGYTYDPAKAKALLAEAGYPNGGLHLKMAYPTGGSGNMFPGPMNEKLKQDLAAVGITVDLVPMEWNNIISGYRAGLNDPAWQQYDMMYFSVAPVSPTTWKGFTSAGMPPNGCCNPAGYQNDQVDQLYAEAMQTFDVAKQNDLLKQLQTVAMKDAPVLVTIHDLNLRVLSPKVQGFVQPQSWFVSLNSVWMRK
jgi:peptide/nickel transport system substrate-binding protein